MLNYEGQTCEVCGKTFDKNSDIVVCPECGTPHHRRCWNQLGHCVNEEKHRSGFEWKPAEKVSVAGAAITCPNCHSVMPRGTLFCENCGTALGQSRQQTYTARPQTGFGGPQQSGYPFGADRRRDELSARIERELAGEIDGVPIKDIAVYVGPNAQYYIYKFRKMEQNPSYKPFCWTAALFSPIYFMFRKMWGIAIGSAVFNFLMNLPALIITAADRGLLSSYSPLMFSGIRNASYICSLLSLAVSILLGFIAIPLYKKATIAKLKELKSQYSFNTDEYYRAVLSQSGPSKAAMVVIAIMVAVYFFNLFMY